jgi:hypothetical protein
MLIGLSMETIAQCCVANQVATDCLAAVDAVKACLVPV